MPDVDAIQFDTGFLSSHTHLGINARQDRVEYRSVTTCAPIITDGYVSDYVNDSQMTVGPDSYWTRPGETWLKYAYGQNFFNFNDSTTYAYTDDIWAYSAGITTAPIYNIG